MITAFLQIFGKILLWIYEFCHSYALSLAIFTLLTKVVLFPISLKGKKSMMQMNMMNGEMQRLQKQYGKDKERYQQEVTALYEREGVNPMGGCLWSFLPLPILMGLYYIIRRPMLYMMCLTNEQITAAITAVGKIGVDLGTNAAYQEMKLSGLMTTNQDVFNAVKTAVGDGASKLVQLDYSFIGIDLAQTPKLMFWKDGISWATIGLFLIPIVVTLLNVGYSRISQRTNNLNGQPASSGNAAADATTKQMMFLMPLMYLWFGYIMPAGMCVYMACSAIFMALQELICSKMLKGQFEKMKQEREARLEAAKEKERQKKAEIAARRAAQAEENKKRGAKAKKKGADGKSKDRPTEDSRVGMRPFARGRAYDPDRYATTVYKDAANNGVGADAVTDRKNGKVTIEYEDADTEQTVDTTVLPDTAVTESVETPEVKDIPEITEAVQPEETDSLADAAFADIQKAADGEEPKE